MNASKDRLLASGKAQIEKSLGTKEDKLARLNKFQRVIRKIFGDGRVFRLGESATKCIICHKPLKRNSNNQIVYYCSDECRAKRHNKKKGV